MPGALECPAVVGVEVPGDVAVEVGAVVPALLELAVAAVLDVIVVGVPDASVVFVDVELLSHDAASRLRTTAALQTRRPDLERWRRWSASPTTSSACFTRTPPSTASNWPGRRAYAGSRWRWRAPAPSVRCSGGRGARRSCSCT